MDPLIAKPDLLPVMKRAVNAGQLKVLYTHVNLDELAKTPGLSKRQHLLLTLVDLGRLVPTGAFVLGYSRLDYARLVEDAEALEAFRSGDLNHTADALIAATAVVERASLITEDRRLRNVALRRDVEVWKVHDFVDHLLASADT